MRHSVGLGDFVCKKEIALDGRDFNSELWKRKRTSGNQWCLGMVSWGQKCGKFPQMHHSERLSFFHLRNLAFMLTSVILLHFVQMRIRISSTDVSALAFLETDRSSVSAEPCAEL